MTEAIVVTPDPAQVSSLVTVSGTGFLRARTRILLDGVVKSNVFKTTGSFTVSLVVGSQAKTQTVTAEQGQGSRWIVKASTTVVVEADSPPPPVVVPSKPIIISAGSRDILIEDKSFTAPIGNGTGIAIRGTAASPVTNVTIRRCTFSGFTYQVFAQFVNGLIIEDCTCEDATIAGIEAVSCVGGTISGNTVRRIGVGYDATPATAWNAYGITVTSNPGERVSTDITVDDNLIEDVPTWIGINVHTAALRVDVTNNTTRRVRRPYFFAPIAPARLTSMTVTGNRAESAGAVVPGEAGIFINQSDGCTVTGNAISADYPHPADGGEWHNYVLDHDSLSTALTRSGNTLI
jgi:hypothetical protein